MPRRSKHLLGITLYDARAGLAEEEGERNALTASKLLLTDRGGLAEEEGGSADELTCRQALSKLRAVIGETAWRVARMP